MVSIRDVANKAGVSPATVSRTFRMPEMLAESTQRRVMDAADQLGYRPRKQRKAGLREPALIRRPAPSAGTAPGAAARTVGFLYFTCNADDYHPGHSFYAPVVVGAQAEAEERGIALAIHTLHTRENGTVVEGIPREVSEGAYGGLLLVGAAEGRIVDEAARGAASVVLVDNAEREGIYESIVSDGFAGTFAATEYLLSLGYRRIGFLMAREDVWTFRDRLRGYRCALLEAGIVPDPDILFLPDDWVGTFGEATMTRLVERIRTSPEPIALVAANDHTCLLVQRVARDAGIRIPEDAALVGFDDMDFAALVAPPLTTLRVPREELGRQGMRLLAARMALAAGAGGTEEPAMTAQRPTATPLLHKLPVTLVVRESCLPVRSTSARCDRVVARETKPEAERALGKEIPS